jgi:cytochrome P450
MVVTAPAYEEDIFTDEGILYPYEHYRALRELGGAVWLTHQSMWVIPRYDDVVAVLRNHAAYSSASGVGINDAINKGMRGTTLASDPPLHDQLRKIIMEPITIGALKELRPQIETEADSLIDRLVGLRSFDAVTALAQHLPLTVVSQLVGLPEAGRKNMLPYAAATFDMIGPDNQRARDAMAHVIQMRTYTENLSREDLKPNSWAARLLDKAEQGIVDRDRFPLLMRDYLGPSLDTTIFATANLIWLFAQFPDQWDLLRADPDLIPNAIDEAVRLESPIRGFTRYVTCVQEVDGVTLQAGSRALVLFASANRDERKWEEPERFDIKRRAKDQVGFGHGVHSCAGMRLAKLEIECLLQALLPRVRRFKAGVPVRQLNNTLRGFASLPVTVEV